MTPRPDRRAGRPGAWLGPGVREGGSGLTVALWSQGYRRQGRPDAPVGEVFAFGATAPFALRGESCAEARARPAERVLVGDREVTELDLLVEVFEAQGVSVIPR